MLLCSVGDLEAGMRTGGSVLHPQRPETELLRPGVTLDASMIRHLRRVGIRQVWVHHDATSDLDGAVASELTEARVKVFTQLRNDFGRLASDTISTATVQSYRTAVSDLICALISSRKFASLSQQMLEDPSGVFSHSASVAYLSILVGLEIESYIVRQRSRMSSDRARDLLPLGLGAIMHDVGKVGEAEGGGGEHEIRWSDDADPQAIEAYREHVFRGYRMLDDSRAPATSKQVVLNHHQKFDGSGWPCMSWATDGRRKQPQSGSAIHIFSRVVAAANVLDNLLTDASGRRRPAVAALHEFAGPRFDGWFDPVVRGLMVRRIPPFAVGAMVRLSDGQAAAVVSPSYAQPCRPSVRLLDDSDSDDAPKVIDLTLKPELHIVECAGEPVEKHLFDLDGLRERMEGVQTDDALAA